MTWSPRWRDVDEDTEQNIALALLEKGGDPETVAVVERRKARRLGFDEQRRLVPFDTRVHEEKLAPAEVLSEPEQEEPPPSEQQDLVVSAVRGAVERMTKGRPRLQRITTAMLAEEELPDHERKLLPRLKARVKEYLEHAQGQAAEPSLRLEIQEMREKRMTWTQIAKQLHMTKSAVMKVAFGPRE